MLSIWNSAVLLQTEGNPTLPTKGRRCEHPMHGPCNSDILKSVEL